jgi:hypothetical protein
MNIENFMEYGIHFGNFSYEQLEEILDIDGIEELPDSPDRRLAVAALGQYLVGNLYDPAKTFSRLDSDLDRQHFVDTWFSAIKDARELKSMGIYLANRLL